MPEKKPRAASERKPKEPIRDLGELDRWSFRDHMREAQRIFNGGKRLTDFFREMDKDRSGELSREEFGAALRNMGFVNATNAQVDDVWAVCDADRSGAIPYKELDTILRNLGERPKEDDVPPPPPPPPKGPRRMIGRFPKELEPDARFAQPTFVQESALAKSWQRRGPGSAGATPLASPRAAETLLLTWRSTLRTELKQSPDSCLALALCRIDERVKGSPPRERHVPFDKAHTPADRGAGARLKQTAAAAAAAVSAAASSIGRGADRRSKGAARPPNGEQEAAQAEQQRRLSSSETPGDAARAMGANAPAPEVPKKAGRGAPPKVRDAREKRGGQAAPRELNARPASKGPKGGKGVVEVKV
jgi:hypothetical protein